jgi:hypothetical protein
VRLKHLDPQDGAHCSLPQFLSPLTALAATPPREAGYREAISCFGAQSRPTKAFAILSAFGAKRTSRGRGRRIRRAQLTRNGTEILQRNSLLPYRVMCYPANAQPDPIQNISGLAQGLFGLSLAG